MTDLQDVYPDRRTVAKVSGVSHTLELREDPDGPDRSEHLIGRVLDYINGGYRRVLWINQQNEIVFTVEDIEQACDKHGVPPSLTRQLLNQSPEDLDE